MRTLLLFDIDGTLLLSARAGAKAMQEAGKRVAGPHFDLSGVEFAGCLDPRIWADGARLAGVADPDALHDAFREAYAAALTRRFASNPTAHTLPGVDALIGRLRIDDRFDLGLVTGNYPETGRLKLSTAGLDPNDFPHAAWGTDGERRRALPPVAIARFRKATDAAIDPGRVVVIGDTVHDVDCARYNGCRAVAVASGPSYSLDALRAAGPDLLLRGLADPAPLLDFLTEGISGRA